MPSREKVVDFRPWGKFTQYAHNQKVTVKIIEIQPYQRLSLQRHQHRDEYWVPLDDGLVATISGERIGLISSKEVYIPRGTTHTIENLNYERARFLEIAFGHFDENDIERLDDKYGRS